MMYTLQPKKLLILNILDILKRYSDQEHRLSQKDIEEILEKDYSMKADRKAIKRNLMNLIDYGYEIGFTEIPRAGKTGEETICTDWYLERDLTDAELRLLIDSVLFSKHLPYNQCKQLIEKLEGLSNRYFSSKMRHVRNLPENTPANPQIFYSIEVLDEAIEKHLQVAFALNEIDHNKKRIVRTDSQGQVRYFTFNPYQMVATNGRYYLIGNFDAYDNLAYVRLDHISDISLLETRAKPMKKVAGLENGLDLPEHMAEHIYMLYGNTVRVHFKAPKTLADQIVDWFGYSFTVLSEDEENIAVQVDVNERAMRFWALQYGTFVEVLEPKSLRADIIKSVRKMMSNYSV